MSYRERRCIRLKLLAHPSVHQLVFLKRLVWYKQPTFKFTLKPIRTSGVPQPVFVLFFLLNPSKCFVSRRYLGVPSSPPSCWAHTFPLNVNSGHSEVFLSVNGATHFPLPEPWQTWHLFQLVAQLLLVYRAWLIVWKQHKSDNLAQLLYSTIKREGTQPIENINVSFMTTNFLLVMVMFPCCFKCAFLFIVLKLYNILYPCLSSWVILLFKGFLSALIAAHGQSAPVCFTPPVISLCVDPSPPLPPRPTSQWPRRAAGAGWPAHVWTPPGFWPPEASVWRKCLRTWWQKFFPAQRPSWCFSEKRDEKVTF